MRRNWKNPEMALKESVHGANMVRVHEVERIRPVMQVMDAILRCTPEGLNN